MDYKCLTLQGESWLSLITWYFLCLVMQENKKVGYCFFLSRSVDYVVCSVLMRTRTRIRAVVGLSRTSPRSTVRSCSLLRSPTVTTRYVSRRISHLFHHSIITTLRIDKKFSCRREATQCLMSLNISLGHSRSLKTVSFKILGTISYSHSISTAAVYLAVLT